MSRIDLERGWLLRNDELGVGIEGAAELQKMIDGWLEANLPCDVHMPIIENGVMKDSLVC
jgi:hypothetical protein